MSESKVAEPSVSYGPLAERDGKGRFQAFSPYSQQRKVLENTLRRAVHQDKSDRLRRSCERLLDIAADSEDERNAMAAFTIIADRLDGKAVARIETSEGAPRELGLADLVALVLNARKTDASDAQISNESSTRTDSADS